MKSVFLMMFLGLGGILIGLSIPLITRRVPPNPWYGFRVRRTLQDPGVWYPVNAYAARRLLWVGIATIIVALTAYFLPNADLGLYASIVGAAAGLGVIVAVVQSFLYLQNLPDKRKKMSPGPSAGTDPSKLR